MGANLAFVLAHLRANFAVALEYRATLFMQAVGMIVNNLLWVSFWYLYFSRFPVLKGWTVEDVVVLWASFALAMGVAAGLFSNILRLPRLISEGQLDYYLALPKDVLLHLLVGRLSMINVVDIAFGPVLLVVATQVTWTKFGIFLATSLLAALVFMGFAIIAGSLSFFLGNSTILSDQLINGIMRFASYPAPIFDGWVKFVLFTVLPAGFMNTLPVELVRAFHWGGFLQLLAGAAGFLTLAVVVFRAGLRRYESGNLMVMRG